MDATSNYSAQASVSRERDKRAVDVFLVGAFLLAVASVLLPTHFTAVSRVPTWFHLPIVDFVNSLIGVFSDVLAHTLRFVAGLMDYCIRLLEVILSSIPWPVFLATTAAVLYLAGGYRTAILGVLCGYYVVLFGLWPETLRTLTLVLFALPVAAGFGFAIGTASFRFRRLALMLDVALDFMQTVPAFAYLVPMIVLFGFGPVPGVIATILYAAPNMARNVRLGLESTPEDSLEVASMTGCSPAQTFFLVRLPAARTQILLGLNQTIMATLSMVIFAAAIGGFEDLGWEVLRAARRAEFGNGMIVGIVITMLAIVVDKATAVTTVRRRFDRRRILIDLGMLGFVLLAGWFVWGVTQTEAAGFREPVASWLDNAVMAISVRLDIALSAIKDSVTLYGLLPLRAGLSRVVTQANWGFDFSPLVSMIYFSGALALAALFRTKIHWLGMCFAALICYVGFAGFPFLPFIAILCGTAWRMKGPWLAMKVFLAFAFIALAGFWLSAMLSLYITTASVIACVVVGGGLGVLAGESNGFSKVMRPLNDLLQTIPPFVVLIPIIMFFKIGEFSSFLAISSYSVAAMARYTEKGIRSVPASQIEAGLLSGCSRLQLIFLIKLPAARNQIILGLRQTVMFALAMVSVAALVGSKGLGQDVYVALGKADAGLGLTAGISIALLAIVADGLLRGLVDDRRSGVAE